MSNTAIPGISGALLAGLLSFLSPCVLPLIPVYLSFISGESLSEIRAGTKRLPLFFRSLCFILGFTVVFVLLALLFGTGVHFIGSSIPRIIMRVAGGLIIVLGLHMIFDFIPFLRAEIKMEAPKNTASFSKAFLFGMLFATGWSPCIGPILSSILIFAAHTGNAFRAALLLGAYSIGLGLPFLLVGLFFDKTEPLLRWFKRHATGVKIAAGILIIVFGILMLTASLTGISAFFVRLGYSLEEYAQTGKPLSSIAKLLARWLQFQGI